MPSQSVRVALLLLAFIAVGIPLAHGDSKSEAALRQELEATKAKLAAQAALTAEADRKAQIATDAGRANADQIRRLNSTASEQGNSLNSLNRQIAQSKADLAQAKADLAVTSARNAAAVKVAAAAADLAAQNVTKLRSVVAQQSDPHTQITAALTANTDAVVSAAGAQTDITREAAAIAARAADTAAQQARAANNANTALFILQAFGFGTVLAGIGAKLVQDRWAANDLRKKEALAAEAQEKKDALAEEQRLLAIDVAAKAVTESEERDGQIHALVNSNLTAAITSELRAHEALLILLEEAHERLLAEGTQISEESRDTIATERLKIAHLKVLVADRHTQTEIADRIQQRQADEAR